MRKISKQSVSRISGASVGPARFRRLRAVLGAIPFAFLLYNPIEAFSGIPPGNSVTLAWNPSPDSSVTGYRLYYGVPSGNYTNSIVVGNVTSNSVSGLTSGVTYFFAITAYNASGVESTFSNEIGYTVPVGLPAIQLHVTPNQQVILTVTGPSGQTHDIQATQTFTNWTAIGTVTIGPSGSVDFADTNAAGFLKRFYRTQQKP